MKPVHIAGLGLWSPGIAGNGEPDFALIPSRLARGASVVTRAAVDVFAQAVKQAAADPSRVAMVFGSAYGEIRTAIDILDMIETEGVPSPARFMNSVHNTAAGLVSIACQANGFATAIAAGRQTAQASLLEAHAWLEERGGIAAIALADESLPVPLDAFGKYSSLAVGFLLCAEPPPHGSLGTIANWRRDTTVPAFAAPASVSANPVAPALALHDAVLRARSGTIRLDGAGGDGWCVDFTAGSAR